MTLHLCDRYDPDCFRCDLSRDEVHRIETAPSGTETATEPAETEP